jgi:hypothetical protein
MYLIPMEAYQHWLRAWLDVQVCVLPEIDFGVEKTA